MTDQCSSSGNGYPSDCEVLAGYRSKARERDEMKNDPYRLRAMAKAKEIKLLLVSFKSSGVAKKSSWTVRQLKRKHVLVVITR